MNYDLRFFNALNTGRRKSYISLKLKSTLIKFYLVNNSLHFIRMNAITDSIKFEYKVIELKEKRLFVTKFKLEDRLLKINKKKSPHF